MASVRVFPLVCVVVLVGVLATPFPDGSAAQRRLVHRRDVAADVGTTPEEVGAAQVELRRPAEASSAPVLEDDDEDGLGRKKKVKKNNSTVGEEVIATIIDGLSGESEDAKFGSEIRQEFGILVQAVTKLGATVINEYAGGSGGGQSRTVECSGTECGAHARIARAVNNVGEGRRRQVRRLLVRYLVLLKVFALGIILPGAVLLAMVQSWKAVTLSLMALLLAGVIGIRGLVNTAAKGQAAEVIHTTGPGSHYWRRVSNQEGQHPDRLAYGAYVPAN